MRYDTRPPAGRGYDPYPPQQYPADPYAQRRRYPADPYAQQRRYPADPYAQRRQRPAPAPTGSEFGFALLTTLVIGFIVVALIMQLHSGYDKAAYAVAVDVGHEIQTWYANGASDEDLVVKMGEGVFNVGNDISVKRPDYFEAPPTTFSAQRSSEWCFQFYDTSSNRPYHFDGATGAAARGICQ